MFTLESIHAYSLIPAVIMALLFHLSLIGLTKKFSHFLLLFILFPVSLMGLSLIIPQDFLQILCCLFFTGGIYFFSRSITERWHLLKISWQEKSSKEKWIITGICIYLFSFFIKSTVLGGIGLIQDSLVYHLAGPKEWALFLNGAKFNSNNPIAFTTSYYDYYYYFHFLITKPLFQLTSTLPSTHYEFLCYTMLLSAQVFTAIVGFVYAPLLILKLARNLGLYKYVAVLFLFGLQDFSWTWILAKNDVFPFICFSLAIDIFYRYYILEQDNDKRAPLFISALLIGIGTTSKLTNAYVVIFSLFFFLIFYFDVAKKAVKKISLPKSVIIIATAMLLGAVIFLIRNYSYTGNPFFPVAKFGFPNTYLTAYADRPEMYSLPGSWDEAILKIKTHMSGSVLLVVFLLVSMLFKTRKLAFFYACMAIFMAKQTGPMYRYRMTVVFLCLALVLFITTIKELDLKTNFRSKKWASGFIIFLVLVFAKIQVEKIVKYPIKIYNKPIGLLLKDNLDHWDLLLSDNLANRDNKKYVYKTPMGVFPYFSRYPVISIYDSVPEHRFDYYK